MDLANWAIRTSAKFKSSIRIFDHIRDPEIPITLFPLERSNVPYLAPDDRRRRRQVVKGMIPRYCGSKKYLSTP